MELIYALVKTFGYLLSAAPLIIVAVLFGLGLLRRLPWLFAAPAMALAAFIAAYPAGMVEGIRIERAAWQLKVSQLQARHLAQKHEAEQKLLAIEKKYLAEQREKELQRQIHDEELDRLFDQARENGTLKPEREKDDSQSCPVCQPYRMRADPGILRNIQKR